MPNQNSTSHTKEAMLKRIAIRKEQFLAQYERVVRFIEKGRASEESEIERQWADEFIKANKLETGLDICCGDFLVENAYGVDGTFKLIGPSFYTRGEELTTIQNGGMDFIYTNYFEALANSLAALNDWYRAIRPGGYVLLSLLDSTKYEDSLGPLGNGSRCHCFTKETIRFYLRRAGFKETNVIEGSGKFLRVIGRKPCTSQV